MRTPVVAIFGSTVPEFGLHRMEKMTLLWRQKIYRVVRAQFMRQQMSHWNICLYEKY